MSEENIPQVMEGEYEPETRNQKRWAEFVETVVVDFFSDHKLEKMSLEDDNGNKAKLARTRDNEVKLEYSTTKII